MHLPETFSFGSPIKINCGRQALAHLPVELAAVNATAPLILASIEQIGRKHLNSVISAFKTSGLTLGVFDQLPLRPEAELLKMLAEMYRNGGCDSLIAVGNGAVVDAAKCLNMIVTTDDLQWMDDPDYLSDDPGPLKPLLLAATAGGNGYETTAYAGDGVRHWFSPRLIPSGTFIDPVMMDGCDDQDIVNGALIALCQAVEAFLDESVGPICHAYAHTAIALIVGCLPAVLRRNNRRNKLCAVVNGQVAAGCAFSASTAGICHHLVSQFSEQIELPLGFLTAALLPHRLEQAGSARPDKVGRLLFPMCGGELFAVTAADLQVPRLKALFWEFFDAVGSELKTTIPSSLEQAGLSNEQIDAVQLQIDDNAFDVAVAGLIHAARKGDTDLFA